jgi:hypothetical protein
MLKFIFRWGFRLLILLVVLLAFLVLCKDALIKSWLEHRIRAQTGMDVQIGRLDIGLFTPTVNFEGLRLFNTAQFGGMPLVDIPDLYLEYDRPAFLRRVLHFKLVRLDLEELNIVEDANGKSILQWWQDRQEKLPKNSNESLDFTGIDVLNLSLGTIRMVSLADPARSRTVRIGLENEVLKNLQSANDLSGLVLKILWQHGGELKLLDGKPKTVPVPATAGKSKSKSASQSPRN